MRLDVSPRVLYAAAAVVLVLAGAVGYAIWRDSQTRSIEFSLDGDGIEIREN
ncbi:MAG: hypothetical protein RKE49_04555 [Oceanicaulis sp.]